MLNQRNPRDYDCESASPRAARLALCVVSALLAWSCGHQETQAPRPTAAPAPSDVVGKTVSFSQTGGSETLRKSGWGDTEQDFTWTTGTAAKLALPVPSASSALTLRFQMSGMINPPGFAQQPVELMANGQSVADWQVGPLAEFQATVPADLVKAGNGVLTLELRTPQAFTPKSIKMNQDLRVLGVCVHKLDVIPAP